MARHCEKSYTGKNNSPENPDQAFNRHMRPLMEWKFAKMRYNYSEERSG